MMILNFRIILFLISPKELKMLKIPGKTLPKLRADLKAAMKLLGMEHAL